MDKIKVLLLSANPAGTGQLKLDEEVREIQEKVRAAAHRDLIQIVVAPAVRPADLLQAMNEHEPHVVQFSGHGNQDAGILVCDEQGQPKVISGEALAELFESTYKNVQVVVLNACYSKPQAEAIANIVPCVIGMKDTIGDKAARVFAASFYSALGFGNSVEQAFRQGLARLKLEGIAQSHIPGLLTRSDVKASEIIPVNP
jgi:CHAT domain